VVTVLDAKGALRVVLDEDGFDSVVSSTVRRKSKTSSTFATLRSAIDAGVGFRLDEA
jgi:hypothetical protein